MSAQGKSAGSVRSLALVWFWGCFPQISKLGSPAVLNSSAQSAVFLYLQRQPLYKWWIQFVAINTVWLNQDADAVRCVSQWACAAWTALLHVWKEATGLAGLPIKARGWHRSTSSLSFTCYNSCPWVLTPALYHCGNPYQCAIDSAPCVLRWLKRIISPVPMFDQISALE